MAGTAIVEYEVSLFSPPSIRKLKSSKAAPLPPKETLSLRVPDCDISSLGRFGLPGDENNEGLGCKSLSFRRRVVRGSCSIRRCRDQYRRTSADSRGSR